MLRLIFALLVALALAAPGRAQVTGPPYVFANDTIADATEVNANFDEIYANAVSRLAGVMLGHLTFGTDNTWDIGAVGASRPRTLYLGTSLVCTGCVDAAGLASTTVSPGAFGTTTTIPTFTVDADGRLTAAGTTATSALTGIAEAGITDGTLLGRLAANETVTGTWSFTNGLGAIVMNDVFTIDNGGSASAPTVAFVGDANTGIWSQADGDFTITTNGTTAFRVFESAGNVTMSFPSAKIGDAMIPTTNGTLALGRTDLRWSEAWVTAGAFNSSDARLKRDIVPVTLGLAFVRQLKPVEYNWRSPYLRGHQYGFLAQDLIPLGFAGVDTSNPDEYGLRYTDLIAPLVKAVQELSEALERANARLAQLEGRVP
jgi:hypothetical protein